MAHIYIGKKYILTVENDRFTIECEGEEICSLIPETAVGTVTETLRPDGIPEFAEQEDRGEELLSFEKTNDNTFVWTAKSPTWAKIYTLTCDPDGFTYSVTVKGSGSIGQICYFADGSSLAETRDALTEKDRHSTYEFYEYFTNSSSDNTNSHKVETRVE